jgi:hypothetical protein
MKKYSLNILHIILLILGTIGLTLFIFNFDLFCKDCILPNTSILNDFGTFYGGLLGTIVASFGLYYIFRTYSIQAKQFDVVKKDADFNIINTLYDNLIQEINSIQFRKKKDANDIGQEFKGIDALYNFDKSHWHSPNAVLNHLQSILIAFEHILLFAERKIRYKYDDQKDVILTRIYFLYYEKIIWPVYQNLYRDVKEDLIQRGHPGTKQLFEKYEDLTKKTYQYLLKRGYVGTPTESEIQKLIVDNNNGR